MTEKELQQYLKNSFPKEAAHCEWKEFKNLKHLVNGKEGDDIISYVSAIANMEGGHLVIGVEDNTLKIVGIENFQTYTPENIVLKILKQCPNLSSEGFRVEPFITSDTNKVVWVFHIPKHLPRKPVLAHNKKWQRIEDSLVEMRQEKEQSILSEVIGKVRDWTAEICKGASLDDLDKKAILLARRNFKEKNPNLSKEVDKWNDTEFLNKAKILIQGKITNTAILLLGKPESESLLNPAIAKIRWILKDSNGKEKDYQIFSCPILIGAEEAYKKIRNLKYRYMRGNTLFPEEVDTYEPYVIREAINNAIAHQDYSRSGYINIIENEDGFLTFSNLGSFIPGSIDKVISSNAPEEHNRNPFLANAMFNFKMVDTIGSGIRRMYEYQRLRFFPLPDYDLSDNKVTVKITGKVLDMNYASILAQKTDLTFYEIVLLDKIQKKKTLYNDEVAVLRSKKLVEGRKGALHISVSLATSLNRTVEYMKSKGADESFIRQTIVEYLRKFKEGRREQFDKIILAKLSESLTEKQKQNRIKNVLQAMKKEEIIINNGKKWRLK